MSQTKTDTTTNNTNNKETTTSKSITTTSLSHADEGTDEQKVEHSSRAIDRMDNRITVHVIQGRNLPAADATGNSDPYVKVTFTSKMHPKKPLEQSRTRIIRKNLNPVWNDTVICQGIGVLNDCDSIVLDVWDYDTATKDDFLGTTTLTGIQHMKGSTLPVWLTLKDKKGKTAGEIQVQITIVEDHNTLTVQDWTHVLELTIGAGIDLDKMSWLKHGHSKPYVRIEWGTQVFHTSKLTDIKNTQWNEKAFIFVHQELNQKYFLQMTVMDDGVKNDTFGQGVLSAQRLFECKENEAVVKNVPLSKLQIEFDKILSIQNLLAQETAKGECGILSVTIKLHPKERVQARYYDAMVDHFDENKNGQLEKEEVQKLLLSLDIPEDPEVFFRKYDEDANDVWSKEEIVAMLKDYDFQRSPWMALALEHFLRDQTDPKTKHHIATSTYDAHLMSGITEPARIGNERRIIKVKDRYTGLVIQENIPGYVWHALQLMYNSSSGRVLARKMSSILTKMSHDKGKEYDHPKSALEIPHFMELHNLDMSIMLKTRVEDYETFNDFFARAIDPKARPVASPDDENVIISPADCRMVLFPNIVDSSIWIKGSRWTMENLLGERYAEIGKKFEGGGFVIARLAPQDYHRFHWPVSGKIMKITPIAGALYTVNPIAINQPINVYTENKRCIIEIDTGDRFGLVVMIPVGATLVGSYRLFEKDGVNLKEGVDVHRGDVAGEFRFGGSTVLVLFKRDTVVFDQDLVTSSTEMLETLIQVNTRIGQKIIRS